MTEVPKRTILPIVAASLIALPALYVASIGPATWAFMRGHLQYNTYETIYDPVFNTAGYLRLGGWLTLYIDCWHKPRAPIR